MPSRSYLTSIVAALALAVAMSVWLAAGASRVAPALATDERLRTPVVSGIDEESELRPGSAGHGGSPKRVSLRPKTPDAVDEGTGPMSVVVDDIDHGASIRGRLVTPFGDPAARTALSVVSAELSHPVKRKGPRTVSDTDGTFVFEGLRVGEYVLLAQRFASREPSVRGGVEIARMVAGAGPMEIQVVLSTPRLIVRLFDSAGGPWEIAARTGGPAGAAGGGAWGEWPRVVIRDAGAVGASVLAELQGLGLNWDPVADPPRWAGPDYREGPGHERRQQVYGGRQYLVTIKGADFQGESRIVSVPLTAGDIEVDFHAAAGTALGTLRVTV